MKISANCERAKALTSGWPAWKREFQLTKNSTRDAKFSGEDESKNKVATEKIEAVNSGKR